MRRRGTARFVLGLAVSFAIYGLTFSPALELGHALFGGAGLIAAVPVLGFSLAVLFTAIYDGPVALVRLLVRHDAGARHGHR